MIHIDLEYSKGYKWFRRNNEFAKGYVFTPDSRLLKGAQLLDYFVESKSFAEFQEKAKAANGLFSVVIQRDNFLWAAIDTARSFPLFYYQSDKQFCITDRPDALKKYSIPFEIDPDSKVIFSHTGFTTLNKTLLKNIFQLQAGECLCFENCCLKTVFHSVFLAETVFNRSRKELKTEFKAILENAGKRMVEVLDGRPVAIPLSGGFDSRLVAYLLRKQNYENVICFTYGKQQNAEVNNARRTAENLRFKWFFIDYAPYRNNNIANDYVFREYVDFATCRSVKFFMQDYFALQELMKRKLIADNTVFIPGHSGVIAGQLLSKNMKNKPSACADHLFEDAFCFIYPYRKDMKILRRELEFLKNPEKKYPTYMIYEAWRLRETTVKECFNALKLWDFFGYEYLIPLWDKEIYDFFRRVPFEHKYDKNLFMETLEELFAEYGVFYPEQELYPSEALVRKVEFRSRLKKYFPFLWNFRDMWKNDKLGIRDYSRSFENAIAERKKFLNVSGIYVQWYLEKDIDL
jgi:asparagine synthase (glutamine-hydrolysing)